MSEGDKLMSYQEKRDFARTGEPEQGGRPKSAGKKRKNKPLFVIQQHDAQSMHYDFRIEVDGVLKSWAVPKGPSTDPGDKRLAIETEDHPIAYGEFEGVIPEGQYGAGAVIIWDRGYYINIKADKRGRPISMDKAFEMGTVEIWLEGEKLKGGYALIRTDAEKWLLVKMNDGEADRRRNPVSTQQASVISGKKINELE